MTVYIQLTIIQMEEGIGGKNLPAENWCCITQLKELANILHVVAYVQDFEL